MNFDLVNILKKFDYACYISAIAGIIPLVMFEFVGYYYLFKISILIFVITFLILISVFILRFVIDNKNDKSSDFSLTKGEKIRNSIYLVFSILALCWFIFILLKL